MLMKKLQGKNKQYFDSGDYNMKSGKKATNPMANPLAAQTVPSNYKHAFCSATEVTFQICREESCRPFSDENR